jgi:hypothetical protein
MISKLHWYPFNFVLPSGDVFTFQDGLSRVIRPDGSYVKTSTGAYVQAENLVAASNGIMHNNPRSGSAVMLPLTSTSTSVELVLFGGQNKSVSCSVPSVATGTQAQRRAVVEGRLASRWSYRLKISTSGSGSSVTYTFSSWTREDMGVRRVGGQATLLPNGDTVVTGGSQAGCVGNPKDGVLPSGLPALWSVLYQAEKDQNKRFTVLNASSVARSYHDTALLTPDGTVLVAGCNVCNRTYFSSVATFYEPNVATTQREYRVEVFHPPYVHDTANRPVITSLKGQASAATVITAKNGDKVAMAWSGASNVTRVALVAPSASTHNFDANQRVIFCDVSSRVFASSKSGTLSFTVPVNANIAIRQYYMVFALNDKVYSKGRWMHVVDP